MFWIFEYFLATQIALLYNTLANGDNKNWFIINQLFNTLVRSLPSVNVKSHYHGNVPISSSACVGDTLGVERLTTLLLQHDLPDTIQGQRSKGPYFPCVIPVTFFYYCVCGRNKCAFRHSVSDLLRILLRLRISHQTQR